MAVPNTNTFSFTDVQTEFKAWENEPFDDLQECVDNAHPSGSPIASGSSTWLDLYPNSLYGFRGYSHFFPGWTYSTATEGIDVGSDALPSLFTIGTDFYMVVGKNTVGFVGYKWSGLAWVSNSLIVTGLPSYTWSRMSVFKVGGTTFCLIGVGNGNVFAYSWNGLSWVRYTNYEIGLIDFGLYSYPTVYTRNGNIYLIITAQGNYPFYGYVWNSTSGTWVATNLITGLPTSPNTSPYTTETFFYGNTLCMIMGSYSIPAVSKGWNFSFSTGNWTSRSELSVGIPSSTYMHPAVAYVNGVYYLALGQPDGTIKSYIAS